MNCGEAGPEKSGAIAPPQQSCSALLKYRCRPERDAELADRQAGVAGAGRLEKTHL